MRMPRRQVSEPYTTGGAQARTVLRTYRSQRKRKYDRVTDARLKIDEIADKLADVVVTGLLVPGIGVQLLQLGADRITHGIETTPALARRNDVDRARDGEAGRRRHRSLQPAHRARPTAEISRIQNEWRPRIQMGVWGLVVRRHV
jgi:hypothetical protein